MTEKSKLSLRHKREIVSEFLRGDQIGVIESRPRYYLEGETNWHWLEIECTLRDYMNGKFKLERHSK